MFKAKVLTAFFPLLLLLAPSFAKAEDESAFEGRDAGLPKHLTHLADLVLFQGGSENLAQVNAFSSILSELIGQANKGQMDLVAEKIDGSPAIVFGYDANGVPFVAYKGDVTPPPVRGKPRDARFQKLVKSGADAMAFFRDSPQLSAIYVSLATVLLPRLRKQSAKEYAGYVFQGDLLFSDLALRRQIHETGVTLSPNAFSYEVPNDHPLFRPITRAKVGIALHSIGRRVIGDHGMVHYEPIADKEEGIRLVEGFASVLQAKPVFVVTPWRRDVTLKNTVPDNLAESFQKRVAAIKNKLAGLSDQFREVWRERYQSEFSVYFNSALYPGGDGGIYRRAEAQEVFNLSTVTDGFMAWAAGRKGKEEVADSLAQDLKIYGSEFEDLLSAYHEANCLIHALLPHMKEGFQSALGGGETEGLVIHREGVAVKLIDRLSFTRKNFAPKTRSRSEREFLLYPVPLNQWRPDAIFIVMKGQPFHAGHIKMIEWVASQANGREVFVIASDVEPRPEVATWQGARASDVGAANTVEEFRNAVFYRPFSNKLRAKMLELSLGRRVSFYFLHTGIFSSWLKLVHDLNMPGKVYRAIGEKEGERFGHEFSTLAPHVEPLYVPMQFGGISGTDLRSAISSLLDGSQSEAARQQATHILDQGLSAVPVEVRSSICRQLLAEYGGLVSTIPVIYPPKTTTRPSKKR